VVAVQVPDQISGAEFEVPPDFSHDPNQCFHRFVA
jgi:hypothetical protein